MKKKLTALFIIGASLSAVHASPWYSLSASKIPVKVLDVDYFLETDPHFLNKSSDDNYIAVPLHYNTSAPLMVWRIADLVDSASPGTIVSPILSRAAEGLSGTTWKGCAIGRGYVIPAPGPTSGLTTSLYLSGGSTGGGAQTVRFGSVKTDGLDLSVKKDCFYSNDLDAQNTIHKWSFVSLGSSETYVDDIMLTSSLARIRNLSAYTVGGKELIYYGEGGTGAKTGHVMVVDTTIEPWSEKLLVASPVRGAITNVKLSGTSAGRPVLYVLSDDGELVVYQLKATGLECESNMPLADFGKTDLARFAGLSSEPSSGKFRNFEVKDDGTCAFFMYGTKSDCNNPDKKTTLTVVGNAQGLGVDSDPFALDSRYQSEETVSMCPFLSRFRTENGALLPKFRSDKAKGLFLILK